MADWALVKVGYAPSSRVVRAVGEQGRDIDRAERVRGRAGMLQGRVAASHGFRSVFKPGGSGCRTLHEACVTLLRLR